MIKKCAIILIDKMKELSKQQEDFLLESGRDVDYTKKEQKMHQNASECQSDGSVQEEEA